MNFIEIIILVIAFILTLSWIFGIRKYVSSGQGITRQTVNTTMLFMISMTLVLVLNWSPFNLLWMFPLSWLLGILSLAFPISLLWIFGYFFALVFTIGLSQNKKK